MGWAKHVMESKEAALEAAARRAGRICGMCGETVGFDDIDAVSFGMLCGHCRELLYSPRT